MAIATQAIPKYLEYRLGEKEKKRNYEHQIGLEMLRQQMWKKRLRAQARKEERDRQMLIERERIALQGDIAKQNRMLKEHQDEMDYKDRLYKLKEKEFEIADKKAQADIIKAQRSGKKTSRDKTLSELLKMLGVTQQERDEFGEPIEGTGDPTMRRNVLGAIKQYGKQKYGIPSGITSTDAQNTMMNYYDQLIKGGIPKETAAIMAQQRFMKKQPRQSTIGTDKPTKESWKDYMY